MQKGEFYLTPPNVCHEQYSSPDEDLIEYGLQCEFEIRDEDAYGGEEIAYLMQVFAGDVLKPVKDRYGAIKLFNKALEEAYYQRPGYYLNIKSLVLQILVSAARSLAFNHKSSSTYIPIPQKNKHKYIMDKIESYVSSNCTRTLTVGDIAAFVYLSSKQLNRIIKQDTGKSAHEYLVWLRLQRVEELLKDTDYRLREIAAMTGFANEFHLSRVFKQYVGINPMEYKKGRNYKEG